MSTENAFAEHLRGLLARGLPVDASSLDTVRSALGDAPIAELVQRLQDVDDAEALPMRELLLFPDPATARELERWLLEQDGALQALDAAVIAQALEGARVRMELDAGALLEIELDAAEARQLVGRLHPATPAPEAVCQAVQECAAELGAPLTEAAADPVALAVLARCRRVRFAWTPAKERFLARLVRGLARGVPGRAAQGPGFAPRLLEAVDWCAGFLEHAGDDVATALAQRRTELLDQIQQAGRVEKMREKYNFETRRMLGITETFTDPEGLRRELALLDDIGRASGGLPIQGQGQVVHRDLDQVGQVQDVEDMQRLLGLLGGEE